MRAAIFAVLTIVTSSVMADQPATVTVELTSGWNHSGHVDTKTNNETLWLRKVAGRTTVRKGIDWQDIKLVVHGEKKLTAEDALNVCQQLATHHEDTPIAQSGPRLSLLAADPLVFPNPSVSSVSAHAEIGNFDRDADVDGLIVLVAPSDGFDLIPTTGILEVELLAERRLPTSSRLRRSRFDRIGRWTRQVKLSDFRSDGAVFKLPFQQIRPGRNSDLLPDGLVNVRLKVPGVGAFDSADHWVRLSPFSRFLDRHYLSSRQQLPGIGSMLRQRRVPMIIH